MTIGEHSLRRATQRLAVPLLGSVPKVARSPLCLGASGVQPLPQAGGALPERSLLPPPISGEQNRFHAVPRGKGPRSARRWGQSLAHLAACLLALGTLTHCACQTPQSTNPPPTSNPPDPPDPPDPPTPQATLASLVLSQGTLNPAFDPAVTSYGAGVDTEVESVTVTPTTTSEGAVVTVQGTTVPSGSASAPIALVLGANTVNLTVSLDDQTTNYTVQITREVPTVTPGSVSRETGVAPLAVHFYPGYLNDLDIENRFHEIDYTWDFGDPGSGTWGTDGKSKNMAKGAIAAHVFESPGTYSVLLTIRDRETVLGMETYRITVEDPEVVFAGDKTTCVSDTAHSGTAGCPASARVVATDDLSTVTQYATPGSRILFARGSTWTTNNIDWPRNAGPVSIGAFGAGTNPDAQGIFENAPRIDVASGTFLELEERQDWRIADLSLFGAGERECPFSGSMELQRMLLLRLRVEGFSTGIGWSHWATSDLMTLDDMVVASCEVSEAQENGLYLGAERLALLGNVVRNARTSHVVRVWQAYRSVISHNMFSGSSLDNTNGRHALKLHGPKEEQLDYRPDSNTLEHRTDYAIVSDNTFGSSGPWPVMMTPQDTGSDERLSNLIFERNRYLQEYGDASSRGVQIGLHVSARRVSVRNNVFDGSGNGSSFTGIAVMRYGPEPAPVTVHVYNNTIFRGNSVDGSSQTGISFDGETTESIVRNNLVSFPGASSGTSAVSSDSADLVEDHNVITGSPGFVDSSNAAPLLRDFQPQAGSPALGAGTDVNVYDDLLGRTRDGTTFDVGALLQSP